MFITATLNVLIVFVSIFQLVMIVYVFICRPEFIYLDMSDKLYIVYIPYSLKMRKFVILYFYEQNERAEVHR